MARWQDRDIPPEEREELPGSATVEAYGSATVRASGSATVRASGSAYICSWSVKECQLNDHAVYRIIESNRPPARTLPI